MKILSVLDAFSSAGCTIKNLKFERGYDCLKPTPMMKKMEDFSYVSYVSKKNAVI